MAKQASRREPFFHGSDSGQLFGIWHNPCCEGVARVAVAMCAPLGAEYFEYHRMMVLLADTLAKRGIPCVRFDYSGWGDSEGSIIAESSELWLSEIGCMVALLRNKTKASQICLCGIRLGASLAARYGAETGLADKLVLWAPIVDGRRYVAELRRRHKRWLEGSFAKRRKADKAYRCLGFPCPDGFGRNLETLNLLSLPSAPAKEALILRNDTSQETIELSQRLGNLGTIVKTHSFSKDALPLRRMGVVVEWIEE